MKSREAERRGKETKEEGAEEMREEEGREEAE